LPNCNSGNCSRFGSALPLYNADPYGLYGPAGGGIAGGSNGYGAFAAPGTPPIDYRTDEQKAKDAERAVAQERLDEAVNDAKYIVAEQSCRDHLGNASTGERPLDVLARLKAYGRVVNMYDTAGPDNAIATGSLGTGMNGIIKLYKGFFSEASADADRNKFSPPLSREKWEALVVVHELAHVLGKNHPEKDDRAYEDAIAKACFNSSKPAPAPAK
jgi:hypothetical protein